MSSVINAYKSIVIAFLFIVVPFVMKGQSFDYQHRPAFDFKFTDGQVNLRVDPQKGAISGSVQYTLKASISGADTLDLDAAELQIDSVSSNGMNINFTADNDDLEIALTDSSQIGKDYHVKIFYHGTPRFGLLKSSNGTVWTSTLPRSNSHWMPVKDQPRVQMVTTLSLQIPSDYTAFASGVKTDENMLPDSSRKVTFRTGRPIPIAALSFGLGHFREKGASVGIKRVNSYAEINSVNAGEQSDIVNNAKKIIGNIEQATKQDYPYQRLNLVILNDHHWEEKSYGASTIFMYKNRGDWMSQLRRGLYAQWIGVFQHEEQWAQSWPISFLQTVLHHKLADAPALLKTNVDEPKTRFSTVYDNFSAQTWNAWQRYNSESMAQVANQLLPELFEQGPGTLTPDSFNNDWYDLSGQPSMKVPQFENTHDSNSSSARDSVRYRVDYNVNKTTGNLQLIFKARQGTVQEPVTLPVKIISGGENKNSQITFSGKTDTVSVSVPAGTQNVELVVPKGRAISLEEHKPVAYLLYQLRNGETTEAKRKAAVQIGYYTDNSDLQLALNDAMKQDMAPEVKAALLRSYGAITNGAEGTQQRFLDALGSDKPEVRKAALEVLNNYKSKKITNQLKSLSQNESDPELSDHALKLYMQRIDSSDAIAYTNTLVQQDTAGTRAIAAIGILGQNGNKKKAVQLAAYYIEPVYSYSVRSQALRILLANDSSTKGWNKRVKKLINDSDPRIRFIIAKNISRIPGEDAASVLSSRKEYDARVSRVINNE